jgi:hypothetical protein
VKKAFFVVNYNNHIVPNSRDSFKDAAQRWGAEYVEVTEDYLNPLPYPPQYVKLTAFDICDADRIFCLDADTIVWAGCPSPFDYASEVCFFAALNKQRQMGAYIDHGRVIEQHEFQRIYDAGFDKIDFNFELFINSGMWAGSKKHHANVLARALEIGLKAGNLHWWDQAALNYALGEHRTSLQIPNSTWNYCLPSFGQWQKMERYIYHFAGMPDRLKIMPQIDWRII